MYTYRLVLLTLFIAIGLMRLASLFEVPAAHFKHQKTLLLVDCIRHRVRFGPQTNRPASMFLLEAHAERFLSLRAGQICEMEDKQNAGREMRSVNSDGRHFQERSSTGTIIKRGSSRTETPLLKVPEVPSPEEPAAAPHPSPNSAARWGGREGGRCCGVLRDRS